MLSGHDNSLNNGGFCAFIIVTKLEFNLSLLRSRKSHLKNQIFYILRKAVQCNLNFYKSFYKRCRYNVFQDQKIEIHKVKDLETQQKVHLKFNQPLLYDKF